MKPDLIIGRVIILVVICLILVLHSCSRTYCARCWASGSSILDIRGSADIRICADDEDQLLELMDYTESMGYECESK